MIEVRDIAGVFVEALVSYPVPSKGVCVWGAIIQMWLNFHDLG